MLSPYQHRQLALDIRELLMIHFAKQELGTSNYVSANDITEDMLKMMENYGIHGGR